MLAPYTKPHLSFGDQLTLLRERGLDVTDAAKAEHHLQRIGYGRLAPYWEPFQQRIPNPADATKTIRLDAFQTGSEFRHAVDLYLFDKRLRLLFLDVIERIEVALRVDLAHALGRRDPWAHRFPVHLDTHRANEVMPTGQPGTRHQSWLTKVDQAATRSREAWVVEFRATYSSPLPIWMAVETWDFGTLSWLLEMAHPQDRAAIARRYAVLPNVLVSWIRTLALIRNISAHHARLWNAGIVHQPKVPQGPETAAVHHIGGDVARRNRVYGATVIAYYLARRIAPGTSWGSRMKEHWLDFPVMPHANLAQAGFLPGWEREAIWA